MDALIMSCSTGGGHNAAAFAVKEELARRGHQVKLLDPYSLKSKRLARIVGKVYILIAQKFPRLFGLMYLLAEGCRRLPFRSPVYYANKPMAQRLAKYLEEHPVDVILMTHLFPAEIITNMKLQGMQVPKTVFIATDYTCIPFTEETVCDYYVIPHKKLIDEYVGFGIPREKLLTFGIPVRSAFGQTPPGAASGNQELSKTAARLKLGLPEDRRYLLISGGSIGAGGVKHAIQVLTPWLAEHKDAECIVICGKNKALYKYMKRLEKKGERLRSVWYTSEMDLYLRACDIYLTKPGGLSSTEAAVSGTPMIHITPIPGCETHNRNFFEKYYMCIAAKDPKKSLLPALVRLEDREMTDLMRRAQYNTINGHACSDICDWLEKQEETLWHRL